MLRWAVKKRLLNSDPTLGIEKLKNDRKQLKIITPEEFRLLFGNDWWRIWNNDRIVCAANKLSALTGLRTGEVLGLRGEFVFDDHIFVCAQYDEYGYRPTKTKNKHNIPLLSEMIAELKELKTLNGDGFLFSHDGGETPVLRKTMYKGFRLALKNIGITKKEITERGLNLHAWRHFCNTELQKAGMSIQKVQAVTGHKSNRITEWYSHFDPMEFEEVTKVQAALLKGND
jgi:integrase